MNKRRHNFTKVLSRNIYFGKKSRKFFATKAWSYMVVDLNYKVCVIASGPRNCFTQNLAPCIPPFTVLDTE